MKSSVFVSFRLGWCVDIKYGVADCKVTGFGYCTGLCFNHPSSPSVVGTPVLFWVPGRGVTTSFLRVKGVPSHHPFTYKQSSVGTDQMRSSRLFFFRTLHLQTRKSSHQVFYTRDPVVVVVVVDP